MELATGNDRLASFNPATGELLGAVPVTAPEEVQAAVDAVAKVQPFWAQLTLEDRARYLKRAAQVVIDEGDEIGELIVREQGKPRTEALTTEVLPTIDALTRIARTGIGILADGRIRTPQPFLKMKRSAFTHEPLGVIGVISPWSYPWRIPFTHVALALMAGNGVVLKPASLTPLAGERIVRVLERAGVPEGLVCAVHGPGTGPALVASSITTVLFTGSARTGRGVGEECARRLKGSALELGGKDPMVVLADANIDHAVAGALWGGFANAGQSGAAIERVYVMREVSERFIDGVVAGARRLRVGDPGRWDTEIGPLTSRERLARVCELVDDALAAGATLLCGGPAQPPPGLEAGAFYAPAVLTGVTQRMRVMREEICGPVLPIAVVGSEEEAVALANDAELGLGASVWTSDRSKGERVARELEAGVVWINDHMFSHGAWQCPWGGVTFSPLGRTHPRSGLYQCVNVKRWVWESSKLRKPWWYPYDETLGRAFRQAAAAVYGRRSTRVGALREGAGPLLKVGARLARDAARRG